MKVKTAYKELERHPACITAISDATVVLAATMQAEMLRIWQSLKRSFVQAAAKNQYQRS